MKSVLLMIIVVLVLALIVALVIYTIFNKIRAAVRPYGQILQAIKDADDSQMRTPKSLSGTEPVHRDKLNKDFPEMNIDVAKTIISNFLSEYFAALSDGNIDRIKEDCSSQLCDKIIANAKTNRITYSDVKVHRVVVSDYKKNNKEATITFQAAVQYVSSRTKKISQEKYLVLYSYYLDYGDEGENASLVCPYCGAPIDTIGMKVCPYCDNAIEASIVRTWKITDVKYNTYG